MFKKAKDEIVNLFKHFYPGQSTDEDLTKLRIAVVKAIFATDPTVAAYFGQRRRT